MSEDVQLSSVTMEFGKFRAVDNVDVTIRAGEFFSFLGPSGCGKTTILRMISGFNDPTAGAIHIGGRDMRGIGPNQRPTALIFQNLALFPLMPVWENIAFGLEVRGVSRETRRRRADELLRLVDLPDAADKRVSQLSGGQKQRVAIARALAVEPKVMLLDEPLSALDLKLRQHMRSELRAIQKRTNVTFVYITHDQGEALAMSDRVGIMSQGVLQQVGTPQEIYNAPANGFVASFVGENNRFAGQVVSVAGEAARFDTTAGTFATRLGPGIGQGASAKVYVRPEHSTLEAQPVEGMNSVPVTVQEVAFEGNFIHVHAHDTHGAVHMVQLPNDPSRPPPAVGARRHLTFAPEHAVVLADAAVRGRA
ncbi:ABC transporter ATP-binding protein [Labrys wisconsinensis]|uniref:Spermidine/putrescine transport system ATP-binding protein n=1 Tax=Labrys wisconsinensis TaxID=425677 RepID=A0ABU0J2Q3_9HYPH|nr:ABC transporter ATP-binding protein [Labrys wisconsinensis]MDQ0467836.1 spermidine/putrescine transport system ATP-binding protein [Labrys wisconsinensis]